MDHEHITQYQSNQITSIMHELKTCKNHLKHSVELKNISRTKTMKTSLINLTPNHAKLSELIQTKQTS